MPIRMLRDWTDSDKINLLDANAERFYTRLIMKVDDYGIFVADPRLLKANLFPLLLDNIREADLVRWMAACQKADLIVLYENANKKYVQIKNFKQRMDRARAKYPFPPDDNELREVVNEYPPEIETETEIETEKKLTATAADNAIALPSEQSLFEKVEKTKEGVYKFIKEHKPKHIEPYRILWNFFAEKNGLSKIETLSSSRKKKLSVRLNEKPFDFTAILKKADTSEFLLTGKWFNFDWVIENDTNYLKILEGKYDSKTKTEETAKSNLSAAIKAIESGN